MLYAICYMLYANANAIRYMLYAICYLLYPPFQADAIRNMHTRGMLCTILPFLADATRNTHAIRNTHAVRNTHAIRNKQGVSDAIRTQWVSIPLSIPLRNTHAKGYVFSHRTLMLFRTVGYAFLRFPPRNHFRLYYPRIRRISSLFV